jgi:hypothetical protein
MSAGPPVRTDRIHYLALGIGGLLQTDARVDAAPFTDAYPVGLAARRWPPLFPLDGYTTGKEYDMHSPNAPRIETLERPVRRTGSETAYPGEAADRWFIEPPNLWHTHRSLTEVTVHARFDCAAGDFVWGSFSAVGGVPISEAGLVTSLAAPTGVPYTPLVAYINFDTIVLQPDSEGEFVWRVRFG